ncbi:hypothetical protein JTE90_000273 [Oedothorax gibbosus]|uniref:Uncharacterized protein n=1 Tax=Oedothorax gibbosus TaxID=931172 RepID=A0AAV6VSB6_9ARAC|nr:hypothetical protein JTE90_000273 [Oedothorax gibbosus]
MTAKERSGEPSEEGPDENLPQIEDINIQDTDVEAYVQLSKELDEINNCLDALEKKNDNLHDELFKLLEENRQIRSELKESSTTDS